jgi:HSP20 family protein
MAREHTTQDRNTQDRNTQQSTTSQTAGSSSAGTQGMQGQGTQAGQGAQGDRERAIQTQREGGRQTQGSTGVARRGGWSPAYGGAGSLASPFTLMQRMAEDMDRLFEQFGFGRTGLTPSVSSLLGSDLWSGPSRLGRSEQALWSPQVEVFQRGNNLVVRADLPGVNKDDLHVDVENEVLTIRGERREEQEENREGLYRSERSYGQFYRAIPLPEGVNAEQVDATYKDGVLEITLPAPKQEERKAKRIQIR